MGDIAIIFSPTAGYEKFYICICASNEHGVTQFLYLNSHDGYEGDFLLDGDEIDCLPKSPTGKSVVCCNTVAKFTDKQLGLYKARKLGVLPQATAAKLIPHVQTAKALNRLEKNLILAALNAIK